jgi:cyclopropane-fatty-acyl-phospholipid synthase
VLDVENLRRHYARTLAAWRERFESAAPRVASELGVEFARRWRLYLAQAEAGFRSGNLQLFQVVFARAQHDGVPWTRAGLYDDAKTALPLAKTVAVASHGDRDGMAGR